LMLISFVFGGLPLLLRLAIKCYFISYYTC
jgi:hypothetical protein